MSGLMKVEFARAPVFRKIKDSLGFTPRFAFGVVPATGFDTVVIVSDTYVIKEYANNTITDVSGSITGSSDPDHSQAPRC